MKPTVPMCAAANGWYQNLSPLAIMGLPELSLICTIFALLSPKTQALIGFLFLKYVKKHRQAKAII